MAPTTATATATPRPKQGAPARRRGPLLSGGDVEALRAASADPFLKGDSVLAALNRARSR